MCKHDEARQEAPRERHASHHRRVSRLSQHLPLGGESGAGCAILKPSGSRIGPSYQLTVSKFRAFLAESARATDQADMSNALPRAPCGRLREDVFCELASPIMEKTAQHFARLEEEAIHVAPEAEMAHRHFAQAALHPLLLRAPFVSRSFAKPLGHAGDHEMVNQILADPRQGPSTYFQIVNACFLKAAVAQAHRNRIDMLLDRLVKLADAAASEGRQMRVLNLGCGPAIEIQRFIERHAQPERLAFTLIDFSEPTLDHTRACLHRVCRRTGKQACVEFVNASVHQLLRHAPQREVRLNDAVFDFVYCAGLFDYLSDRLCSRLLAYFVARTAAQGTVLVTNVHACNPQRKLMEHLLEWHLICRDAIGLQALLPEPRQATRWYTDATGVNVFAEFKRPVAPLKPR